MTVFAAGTRGSALARWQTDEVARRLVAASGGEIGVTVRVFRTAGDETPDARLQGRLEKGFFTAELEAALRRGEIGFAVHSLKDLPTALPTGLSVVAVLARDDPRDWLIVRPEALDLGGSASRLPLRRGSSIGTSSLRRESLARALASDCRTAPLRGNVPTRIERLREGRFDAIVVAAAGVRRLSIDLRGLSAFALDPRIWIPAPAQGAIAIEARTQDIAIARLAAHLDDRETRAATSFERRLQKAFEGGCSTAFACYWDGAEIHLGLDDSGRWRTTRAKPAVEPAEMPEDVLQSLVASARRAAPPDDEATPLWHAV